MTTHDLYAIYAGAYVEYSHFASGRLPAVPAGISSRLRRFLSVERAIEELGRHDATDGRPMRTRIEFAEVIRQGRQALTGLGAPLSAGT